MITETTQIKFNSGHGIYRYRLPDELLARDAAFNNLWMLHPDEFPSIFIHGRHVALPRWQQAYGRSYFFSGKKNRAKSVPEVLKPYLSWAQQLFDRRYNGMLLNWYDGQAGHYIGAHCDSTKGLVTGSSIIMISLGGSRVMRFRHVRERGFTDIAIENGDVIIMPLSTNQHYKHEVPRFKRHQDKRISITLRCFETSGV